MMKRARMKADTDAQRRGSTSNKFRGDGTATPEGRSPPNPRAKALTGSVDASLDPSVVEAAMGGGENHTL